MAPKLGQQSQRGRNQRSISSFFKPKTTPPPASHISVPRTPSTTPGNLSQREDASEASHGNVDSGAAATPGSGLSERPAKRARTSLTPGSGHSAGDVILLEHDEARPGRSTSPGLIGISPPDEGPGASPTSTLGAEPRVAAAHAAHIPPRAAGRHARFQHKLAQPSPRELAAGGDACNQPYTPLELQIVDLKRRHPGVLLVVEVGYKFRFFGEDAQIASQVCNIFAYQDRHFLCASVPVHRMHVHVRRLVQAGHKVGLVTQTETAAIKNAEGKGAKTFSRELTAMYTASTMEAGDMLGLGAGEHGSAGTDAWSSERLSNWLVAVIEAPSAQSGAASARDVDMAVVAVETSTGDVLYSQFRDGMMRTGLESRLLYAAPRELLLVQPLSDVTRKVLDGFCAGDRGVRAESVRGDTHGFGGAMAAVTEFYEDGTPESAAALESLRLLPPLVVQALAHALDYLRPFGLEAVLRLGANFRPFAERQEMQLSPNALRQLEVLRNEDDGTERGSLLWLLDQCVTPAGGRLLRAWVSHPLTDAEAIGARLDAVEELAGMEAEGSDAAGGPLASLRRVLSRLPDVERGITRVLHKTASPAEFLTTMRAMGGLKAGLGGGAQPQSSLLRQHLADATSEEVRSIPIRPVQKVSSAAARLLSLLDSASAEKNDKMHLFTSAEAFPFLAGVFKLAADAEAAATHLDDLLPGLRRQLRLPRMAYVSLTNQGDYLVEVPAGRKDVPKDWQKVSGTKAVNRYRPPAVTAGVAALELAREHHAAACTAAWLAFLGDFTQLYLPFRAATRALAALDALQSLAAVARNEGYVRPTFMGDDAEPHVELVGSRHPVLDALATVTVVPNDISLSASGCRVRVITGPNMGGKSTVIRQAALICIMAQVGSFVPAQSASMHVVDAIHTRMGAQDNLALGRSTFLEELSEASAVLRCANPRSLVIMDELGRGTATHDGLAIALATLQALVEDNRCLTLFVTHYPQVAAMRDQYPGTVGCSYMSFVQSDKQEAGGTEAQQGSSGSSNPRITFLYRLTEGVADRSFGLNVARMAQLPAGVVERAAQVAASMEEAVLARRSGGMRSAVAPEVVSPHQDPSPLLNDVGQELRAAVKRLSSIMCTRLPAACTQNSEGIGDRNLYSHHLSQ